MTNTAIDMTRAFQKPTELGRCKFNKRANTIEIEVTPGYTYWVDLGECTTSQQVLDWLHQISQKSWASEVLSDFLELLFNYIPGKLWHGGA